MGHFGRAELGQIAPELIPNLMFVQNFKLHSFQHLGPCRIRRKGIKKKFPKIALLSIAFQDSGGSNCYHCKSDAFHNFVCESHQSFYQSNDPNIDILKVNFLSVTREKDTSGVFHTEFYGSGDFRNPEQILDPVNMKYMPNGQNSPTDNEETPVNGRQKPRRIGEGRHQKLREQCENNPLLEFLLDCLLKENFTNTTVN